ncbi:MAG TPA: CHAP domain-containing protein, partial [Mycobacterium sp.]
MTAPMQTLPRDLPAPTTAARVIARLLLFAGSQIGYREGRDSDGDWNNDNAFGKWYGTNGVSWCAQFVSWAAFVAGVPTSVIPKHQYTPTGWNWFTAHDRDVSSPRSGDIFYVYGYVKNEGNRVHHVGIVEKVLSDGRIQTIEGNTSAAGSAQGNGVYRLTRILSSKLRFARPDYAAAV